MLPKLVKTKPLHPIIVHQSIFKFIFGEKLFKRANFSSFSFFPEKYLTITKIFL